MIKHVVIAFLIITGFFSAEVFACFCAGERSDKPANNKELVERLLSQADVVFIGKVTRFEYKKGIQHIYAEQLRRHDPTLRYETQFVKFEVKRWWKGALGPATEIMSQQIKLSDGNEISSSCDYSFKAGEVYLVFGYHSGEYVTTNSCVGNNPLNEVKDLHLLGESNPPVKRQGPK